MKKLIMVLAVAFTMGLAASTASASTGTKDNNKKAKTECTSKDSKACCKKDGKTCTCKAATTDTKTKDTK